MFIIDQCNETARVYEIQVTVIYSRASLVVMMQTQIRRHRKRRHLAKAASVQSLHCLV